MMCERVVRVVVVLSVVVGCQRDGVEPTPRAVEARRGEGASRGGVKAGGARVVQAPVRRVTGTSSMRALSETLAPIRPYPKAWLVEEDGSPLQARCPVYKDGCNVVRSGRLTVEVTLDPSGAVKAVRPLSTTVRVDPKLMEACGVTYLKSIRFKPPKGYLPRAEVTLRFGDKC